RAAAANALGRIGSRESLGPLENVTHDRVRTVALSAREAIQTIETASQPEPSQPVPAAKARFGWLLGEMRNQSALPAPQLIAALSASLERNLPGMSGAAVFSAARASEAEDAQGHGLSVYRLDGSVTRLSAELQDGQLSVHCEVSLLVMDRPTG